MSNPNPTPSQILEDYGAACMDYVADKYIERKTGKKFLAHAPRTEAVEAQLDAYYRDMHLNKLKAKAVVASISNGVTKPEITEVVRLSDVYRELRAALKSNG